MHSYLAFIDESGDDGLENFRTPGARGGSSHWLVLSACVLRQIHCVDAVAWRDEISLRLVDKKSRILHFSKLNHNQRVVAVQTIATKPLCAISILAKKQIIPKGTYSSKNQLYFHMARYLLERISWLCRDLRKRVPEGDGRVAITFSRRGGMSYDAFREYLVGLRISNDPAVKIHWPVIDIDSVEAKDHSTSASLQLADVIASSFACAVEPNIYGNCELRYAEILKPITYQRKGNYLSHGLKMVPKPEDCGLGDEQQRLIELFR